MQLSLDNKRVIVKTLLFFVIVNTSYYWLGKLSLLAFPAMLLLAVLYLALCISLLRQVYHLFREKFRDKQRLIPTTLLIAVLVLTAYRPFGFIDFDRLEGEDLLVAEREGAANCRTTIKLKDDLTFREQEICFGQTDITGTYQWTNDTLFFEDISLPLFKEGFYKFAIIETPEDTSRLSTLIRYKDFNDTTGHKLWITKNELQKLNNNKRHR